MKRFVEICIYKYHKLTNILASVAAWLLLTMKVRWIRLWNPSKQVIGVLLAEHFGDIVASEPLVRAIKEQYPNALLYWIVKKSYRELVDTNPFVDKTVVESSVLFSILLTKKSPFTAFYNLHLSDLRRYSYTGAFLKNEKAIDLGITLQNYFEFGNLLEVFGKVSGLPILSEGPKMYIPTHTADKIKGIGLPQNFVVLHCSSNQPTKDWQVYHWERLVQSLIQDLNIDVVEVGLTSQMKIDNTRYHNLCGKYSLIETAEIIKGASLYIGIDSGPAHLANAVGTYGILLFGKLNTFENYMPYSGAYQNGSNAQLIIKEKETCSELDFDTVWEVIKRKYPALKVKNFNFV